ncbi:PAS domain S-box protein [Bremerella sp. JC817]|uniref:PAS domain S-box protein n=1 Tax=Bremerella sp. JC817 TaxID=3231756 RepID=UPI0034597C61
MNLLRKYFLLGAIPALIAVGLATILDYQITQTLLQEQIDQTLNAKLEAKRQEVRLFMDEHLSLLKALSISPQIADGKIPQIVDYLKIQESVVRPNVEGLFYVELDGTVHATDGSMFDVSDRLYFPDVLDGKQVITRILKSRSSGNDVVLLINPVHALDGTLKGAVSLTIPESNMVSFVHSMEVDRGGFYALVDHENRLIAATEKADFLRNRPLNPGKELVTDSHGIQYLVSLSEIPESSWYLIAAIPEAEVKSIYNRMAWSKVTAVCCGITVAVILALFFSERALRPLQQMIQAIRRYARGDRTARVSEKTRGEYAILADSFNNLADELDAAQRQQEEHLRTIEASEDRFRRLFDGAADAIFLRNLEGTILDANQEACRSLGYERHELIGRTVADIDTKWTRQDANRLWNQLAREGGRYHPLVERVHRRKDGSTFPVEIRLTLIEREGEAYVMSAARDATLRKAAEKQLQEAKEFAEKMINATPGLIYIFDLTTQSIVFINDNVQKQLGYTREYVEELGSKFYGEVIHPDDLPRLKIAQDVWKEEDGEPLVRRDNFRLADTDGNWVWFEFHRVVFQKDKDGNATQIMGIATNISDRVRAEQQLVWEKALLDQVMETSVAAIMVLDADANVRFMNTALEKTLRIGRDEVLGKNVLKLDWEVYDMAGRPLPPENRPFATIKRTLQPIYDARYRVQFGDDAYTIISNNGAPLFDENGEFDGVVFALTDITERIESEKLRDSLIRDLEATNTELKQFTYTVSHDLKSPLITIKGFLGILSEDIESGDKAAIDEDLSIIGSAADGMKQLLDDLLELSRIGRNLKSRTEISLDDVVREAITLLAGEIESREADIQSQVEGMTIYADPVQIRQLFQNLIDNGIKHNRKENPRVTISARKADDEFVTIDIADNGPGVALEYQERIFQLFDKLDPESDGTGIGLAIVKRIVDFHGGTIALNSDGQGNGCTFTIRLPTSEPEPSPLFDLQDSQKSTSSS